MWHTVTVSVVSVVPSPSPRDLAPREEIARWTLLTPLKGVRINVAHRAISSRVALRPSPD